MAERHFMYTSGDLQTVQMKLAPQSTSSMKVDWNKEMVIGIFLGERKTGGYKVYVETIDRTTAAVAVVKVVEQKPVKDAMVTEAITSPFILIAIEKPGVVDWQFSSRTSTSGWTPGAGCGCECKTCTCSRGVKVYNPYAFNEQSFHPSLQARAIGQLPFAPYFSGYDSEAARPEVNVIRSQSELDRYWNSMLNSPNMLQAIRVDFSREQVVAVHAGATRNRFSMEVFDVRRVLGNRIEISVKETPVSTYNRSVISPFALIRMIKTDDPISVKRFFALSGGKCGCGCSQCKH